MDNQTITIDLLRHGECVGGNIFRGSTDVELTEKGWEQMQNAVDTINYPWNKIISSDLKRCKYFASRLAENHDLALEINPNWRELSFGVWEGHEISKIWDTQTEDIKQWSDDPSKFTPAGGDQVKDVAKRVELALDQIVKNHENKHILLVTHGGIIRILLGSILKMPFNALSQLQVPYACISRIQFYISDGKYYPSLCFHNPVNIL